MEHTWNTHNNNGTHIILNIFLLYLKTPFLIKGSSPSLERERERERERNIEREREREREREKEIAR